MATAPAVTFGCTALVGTNKRGTLRCDSEGYYPVVLGALNHFNSAGCYYPLEPAKALFEASSAFMRRVGRGALNGECGHPRKLPGMSNMDFVVRLNDIYEPNVSHHIRKVWLEDGYKDEAGRPIVLIMGDVRPAGPKGPALKDALENRHADVCFSIRSFTEDVPVAGVWNKRLKQIVTWDWVNEPGISAAEKWRAPALESLEEETLSKEAILQAVAMPHYQHLGLESQRATMEALARTMGWTNDAPLKLPASARWK